jgi:hypothetical protein
VVKLQADTKVEVFRPRQHVAGWWSAAVKQAGQVTLRGISGNARDRRRFRRAALKRSNILFANGCADWVSLESLQVRKP